MRTPSTPRLPLLRRAVLSAAVALVFCAPAHAETTVWLGGSTDNNWSTAANWLNSTPPTSGNTSDIVFAASPRTALFHDIGNPFTVRGLFFSDNPYFLSGNSLTFDGAFAAIHNSTTLTIFNLINLNSNMSYNGAGDANFPSQIDGPGGFIKNGTGTVNLTFTTYTGPTDINAGQIALSHSQGLLFTTVNLNTNDGLNLNGHSAVIGNIAGTGSLNLGSANITVGSNNTSQTYSGQFSGTGGIRKIGDGTWTLTGAGSSFSRFSTALGPTILSGGSLTLNSTGAAHLSRALTVGGGVPGSMTVQSGAVLNTFASGAGRADIRAKYGVASTMTVSGASSRWDAAQIDIGGEFNDLGVLVADNGGVISATDIFVGQPEAGTLLIQNGSVVSSNRITVSGGPADRAPTVSVRSNGEFNAAETILATPTSSIDVDRGTLHTAMLTSIGGNGSITLRDPVGGSALVISGTGASATYTGSIAGNGSITKNGAATQILYGQNDYSGPTTVNDGHLILTSGSSASYNANATGRITLDFPNLGHSALRVSGGGTIEYPPVVIGGFIRGSDGNHDLKEVATFNGTTFAVDSAITVDNPLALNNVTNSGNLTSNKPFNWNGGVNTSAGRVAINSEASVASFENNGVIAIQRRGLLLNSDTDLVSGGGGRITIDEGGSLEMEKSELHLNGSLLVNNGRIRGVTNVNFGSLLTGTGEFGEVFLHPGGTFTPGVAFGIKPNTASDLATIVTTGGDQTVTAPITLRADTVAAVPSDTLRITAPFAAAGVKITKTDAGTLELKHVRAAALAIEGGRVVVTPDGTAAGASELAALTLSGGGTFDLTDNDLLLHATAATRAQRLRELEAYAAAARNGDPAAGRWRGPGLTSSAAATNPLATLALGTSGDDALVARYTYNGDANLDGRINADDYFRIDQGFLAQPPDPFFSQGDFNYDGRVNADDYFLIDQAFLGQGAPLAGATTLAAVSVPEPAAISMALACVAGVTLRPRRRAQRGRHHTQ